MESSPGMFLIMCTVRAFTMQVVFRIRNGLFLPLLFVTSFLSSIVRVFSLMRGSTQKQVFFSRMIRRPRVPRTKHQVPGIYTAAVRTAAGVVYSTYPDRTAVRKKLTPLESSYGLHLPHVPPLLAQNAGVVSTPSERRRHRDAELAGREHRVGSLFLAGQNQTQAHSSKQQYEELVDNS